MELPTVKQENNTVGGDQAGRDIIKNYHFQPPATTSQMARMISIYRAETEKDRQIKAFIDKLQRWQDRPVGDVLGLEEKLKRGNRPDIIDVAVIAKDRFYKTLYKHEYSPAAQEIYAYLLAKIYQLYSTIIFPHIIRGATPELIDKLLATEVYEKIEAILEDNPLGVAPDEIMGMLFWLTGNCHLKWESNVNIQPGI